MLVAQDVSTFSIWTSLSLVNKLLLMYLGNLSECWLVHMDHKVGVNKVLIWWALFIQHNHHCKCHTSQTIERTDLFSISMCHQLQCVHIFKNKGLHIIMWCCVVVQHVMVSNCHGYLLMILKFRSTVSMIIEHFSQVLVVFHVFVMGWVGSGYERCVMAFVISSSADINMSIILKYPSRWDLFFRKSFDVAGVILSQSACPSRVARVIGMPVGVGHSRGALTVH